MVLIKLEAKGNLTRKTFEKGALVKTTTTHNIEYFNYLSEVETETMLCEAISVGEFKTIAVTKDTKTVIEWEMKW